MVIRTEADVTDAVLQVMERTRDPRLREIMVSLVKHLHGFIREVRLTEEEFRDATAVLNEIGALASDSHNEFVLMSGSLGVSTLVCLLNNGDQGQTETSQSLLGPVLAPQLAARRERRHHHPLATRRACRSSSPRGCRTATATRSPGAEVDVWHASPVGLYENQDPDQAEMNLRGKFTTDADGRFWFWTVKMVGYPIPIGRRRRPAAEGAGPPSLPAGASARADLQPRATRR